MQAGLPSPPSLKDALQILSGRACRPTGVEALARLSRLASDATRGSGCERGVRRRAGASDGPRGPPASAPSLKMRLSDGRSAPCASRPPPLSTARALLGRLRVMRIIRV